MGFYVPPTAPTYGPEFSAASFDALVTAMAAADDGAWGQDTTTGLTYRAVTPIDGSPVVLVPPDLYEATLTRVSNATGEAWFKLADALASVSARGWVASGGASKTGGAALVLGVGAGLQFVPTAWPTRSVMLARVTVASGTAPQDSDLYFYRGAGLARLRVSASNGAAGTLGLLTGLVADTDAIGAASITPTAWLLIEFDATATTSISRVRSLTSGAEVMIQHDEIETVPDAAEFDFFVQGAGGLEITDCHWFEVT